MRRQKWHKEGQASTPGITAVVVVNEWRGMCVRVCMSGDASACGFFFCDEKTGQLPVRSTKPAAEKEGPVPGCLGQADDMRHSLTSVGGEVW